MQRCEQKGIQAGSIVQMGFPQFEHLAIGCPFDSEILTGPPRQSLFLWVFGFARLSDLAGLASADLESADLESADLESADLVEDEESLDDVAFPASCELRDSDLEESPPLSFLAAFL